MGIEQGLHTLGNTALLSLHKVAFLCSRNSPAGLDSRVRDWAFRQCEDGVCVISGFHSRLEKKVLHFLLQGSQPIILVLACGFKSEVEPELQVPLAAGRLLAITRYAPSVTHPCQEKCHQRNRLMLEMAEEAVVAYAAPGGNLERLCAEYRGRKPLRGLSDTGEFERELFP
jgi:predicted Rossmann fold nucleotide-binding protein DprA/Smf involved in DNA uptake